MKKYVFIRILKAIVSLFIVLSIVITMLFKLVPMTKAFEGDEAYRRLQGNEKKNYTLQKLESLGYMDYYSMNEICATSKDKEGCLIKGSEEQNKAIEDFKNRGFTIDSFKANDGLKGEIYAYRDYSVPEILFHYLGKLVVVDGPNAVQDPENPDMERGIFIEKGYNGIPAIACSGCTHRYLFYIDSKFPFIHSNWIKLHFGESYPQNEGIETLDVISDGQGQKKKFLQTYPTGYEAETADLQYTRTYKAKVSHLDERKYEDNYANTRSNMDSPSMIGTSYIFGVLSVIFAYLISIPVGIAMARNKGKLIDKIGIVYINLTISLPSLALIFFIKEVGRWFGMPSMFSHTGFGDIKSYIMPIVALTMMNMPGLMMWIRRYMVDQSNADYVKFAKAKGLSKREISSRHIFKNAVIPIVNGIPASIILAISGAVVTESMFGIPGMGKMLPDSIAKVNNNMVITLTFIFTALSVMSVLLGDLLMTVVDPRIQLTAKKGE